jgi:hypothetical protein
VKRYGETCGLCGGRAPLRDTGALVLHTEAQTEIAKRDQTIADLKALLYRAAEGLDCGTLDTYRMSCAEYGRLVSDIEKAIA